jgi:ADP-ribosyl-[dinitrogen reductase] hydrolase
MTKKPITTSDSIFGALLGGAVADALGLPYEGLSKQRAQRLLGAAEHQRLCFGYGLVSDDTDHSIITALAWRVSAGDPLVFGRALAWGLRWWLLSLPAGVGLATLRATVRLWLGIHPSQSGVFSAGNGPAMRAAVLGALCPDLQSLQAMIEVSSRITHRDPQAAYGALAIALAAHLACRQPTHHNDELMAFLRLHLPSAAAPLLMLIEQAYTSASNNQSTEAFAQAMGWTSGISGYINHTCAVVFQAIFRHPNDYAGAIQAIIACGGDTDTTAAFVGGVLGAKLGASAIPDRWRKQLWLWPYSERWLEQLAQACSSEKTSIHQPFWPIRLLRNLFFLVIVLLHGLRRLLPPY